MSSIYYSFNTGTVTVYKHKFKFKCACHLPAFIQLIMALLHALSTDLLSLSLWFVSREYK